MIPHLIFWVLLISTNQNKNVTLWPKDLNLAQRLIVFTRLKILLRIFSRTFFIALNPDPLIKLDKRENLIALKRRNRQDLKLWELRFSLNRFDFIITLDCYSWRFLTRKLKKVWI